MWLYITYTVYSDVMLNSFVQWKTVEAGNRRKSFTFSLLQYKVIVSSTESHAELVGFFFSHFMDLCKINYQ